MCPTVSFEEAVFNALLTDDFTDVSGRCKRMEMNHLLKKHNYVDEQYITIKPFRLNEEQFFEVGTYLLYLR